MNSILGLVVALVFLANSCPAGGANGRKNGKGSPPDVINVETAAYSEDKLVHIAQERLLRAVVEIDSTVRLGDQTIELELDSFPPLASASLVSAFRQANTATNAVRPPFDVYAKIVPVTYSGSTDDLTKIDRRGDGKVKGLVLLSGTGIIFRDGNGNHFERDPVELFGCASVVSDKKLTSLFCLYTSYDGGTNIFKDQLFELDPDGKWLPK